MLDALRDWALDAPTAQAQIVVPSLGGDSVTVGAAGMAFADLLQDPVGVLAGAAGDAGTVLDA